MNALTPFLTWLVTEVLADLPFTDQYVVLYSVAKNWMHQERMYKWKGDTSLYERLRHLWDNVRLDVTKQISDGASEKLRIQSVKPGQTLGASPHV
ncbi:MAG: hypothetical protein AAB923_03970 [Patescibacteria group bacterium]